MTDACSASTPALHDRIAPAIAASGTHISGAPRDTGPRGDGRADLVVIGAISTGDADSPTAEAMAIADGRIVGLGTRDDVEGLIGPGTRTLRPDGVVLPGLIEPHAHVWVSLLMLDWVDVSHPRCATFDDVVTTLKKAAGSGAPGEYLLAKLFDPSLYAGEPDLTRDILDRVALDRPVVVLNASMHFAYANSRALEAAGITDGTPAQAARSGASTVASRAWWAKPRRCRCSWRRCHGRRPPRSTAGCARSSPGGRPGASPRYARR